MPKYAINAATIKAARKELTHIDHLYNHLRYELEYGCSRVESDKAREALNEARAAFDSGVAAKINEVIKSIEGRAKERTVSAKDLIEFIETVEEHLFLVSTKVDAIGTTVEIDPNAQHFPNAYKYIPMSTHFYLELTKSGWVVTKISREACFPKTKHMVFTFTEATKANMAARLATA